MKVFWLLPALLCVGCVTEALRAEIKEEAIAEVKVEIYQEAVPVIRDTALEVIALNLPSPQETAEVIASRSAATLVDKAILALPKKVDKKADDAECKTVGNIMAIGSQVLLFLLSMAGSKTDTV